MSLMDSTVAVSRRVYVVMLLAGAFSVPRPAAAATAGLPRLAVEITVNRDNTVTVTDQFTELFEEGDYGIVRDFSIRLRNRFKAWCSTPLQIRSVLLDGSPVTYSTEYLGDRTLRLRAGDPRKPLYPGEHTFTITCTRTRMLRFAPGSDTLVWRVAGYPWRRQPAEITAFVRVTGAAAESLRFSGEIVPARPASRPPHMRQEGDGVLFRMAASLNEGQGTYRVRVTA